MALVYARLEPEFAGKFDTAMRQALKFLFLGALFASPSAAENRDPAALYQRFCSVCHGDRGNADSRAAGSLSPRPRDFTSPEAAAELTRDRMIKSVRDGRPGTAMVGHGKKLDSKEIEGVVDYIRTNFMQTTPASGSRSVVAETSTRSFPGVAVYKKHCASCHGDDGNASSWARNSLNPPPRDFTAPGTRAELTRERMIQSITRGRPGTAMQPFSGRLAAADIDAVVTYIRTNFMKVDDAQPVRQAGVAAVPADHPHRGPGAIPMTAQPADASARAAVPPTPADMKLPFPNKLKGNARSGETFYMRNCVVCHGAKGDGNGPRAYFITPRPRNFTAEQSRQVYNRPQLFDAVAQGKRGTVMPAWGKVLDQQQIADVAEFVFQAYVKGSYKITSPDASGDEKKK